MSDCPTKPLLAIYVAWHPNFDQGQAIADAMHDHYRQRGRRGGAERHQPFGAGT
jgi:hypothetical protein